MRSTTRNIIVFIFLAIGIALLISRLPITELLILLPFILIYLGLKLPVSKSIVFDSRIKYKMVDTGQSDFIRNGLEYLLGNKKVFLADPIRGLEWVYVNKSDYKKLWPESPLEMSNKHYTIKARFETNKLLLGGYARAKLINIKKIEENPIIIK